MTDLGIVSKGKCKLIGLAGSNDLAHTFYSVHRISLAQHSLQTKPFMNDVGSVLPSDNCVELDIAIQKLGWNTRETLVGK